MSVARSLQVRDGLPLASGLQLWADYNQRLLEITAREKNVLWFDFDRSPGEIQASVQRISTHLGLETKAEVAADFNPLLRHHPLEFISDPRLNAIYQELCNRCRLDGQSSEASQTVASPAEPYRPIKYHASLVRRVEQFAHVQSLENASLQQLQSLIFATGQSCNQLQARLDTLGAMVESVRPQAELASRFDALHAELHSVRERLPQLAAGLEKLDAFDERLRTVNEVIDQWRKLDSVPLQTNLLPRASRCMDLLSRWIGLLRADRPQATLPAPHSKSHAASATRGEYSITRLIGRQDATLANGAHESSQFASETLVIVPERFDVLGVRLQLIVQPGPSLPQCGVFTRNSSCGPKP